MRPDRNWMYTGRIMNGLLNVEFVHHVEEFVNFALQHPGCISAGQIKCPCSRVRCQNMSYQDVEVVKFHLAKHGFVRGYWDWIHHGEANRVTDVQQTDNVFEDRHEGEGSSSVHRMLIDAAGPEILMDDPPNEEAQKFYDMMRAAEQDIWPGNHRHSPLSAAVRMLDIKCRHQASEGLYNDVSEFIQELLPEGNLMAKDFYNTKKLVKGLGLPVEVIDCCYHNCMIYWGDDSALTQCKVCNFPRWKTSSRGSTRRRANVPYRKMHYFPITPRLQRLYASRATAKHMRWHAEHEMEDGKMCHPSDSPAWKHFSDVHQDFAAEVRNIRLGLCSDGFQPFGQMGQQYSSWPVILTPYNLPPGMCMKDEFMFLTILVPGPRNPKAQMDIFLQPLIAELIQLWEFGTQTYDMHKRQNFQMRAALMWTINDFPAYSMLSGWSTSGKLACPYCMEDTDAFTLTESGKQSWFDCHRKFLSQDHPYRRNRTAFLKGKRETKEFAGVKTGEQILYEVDGLGFKKAYEVDAERVNAQRSKNHGWNKKSIFWDLPYWKTNLIRHNLDVMHIEKNVFDNIFNTVLNVPGKTKDNAKSREELNEFCNRPELAFDPVTRKYPKASYALDRESKQILCEWVKQIKFPDGYVSNMGRCVDSTRLKLFGMKSHDCHIFMQRLLPIALRELLPKNVWEPITELCIFFKDLTSTSLKEEDLKRMESEIPKILCKLERIFPPSFFNSMEHLPVHLPYEAMMAGPVQYRWMYPFERYLRKLKRKVTNKGRVEGSISSGYRLEEVAKFASFYFKDDHPVFPRKMQRNEVYGDDDDSDDVDRLSIFKHSGRPIGASKTRYLTDVEYAAARSYILLNCPEIDSYKDVYVDELLESNPWIRTSEIEAKLETEFASWFERYAQCPTNRICNPYISSLAMGPLRQVTTFTGYCINGFKFQTQAYGGDGDTMNSGVCVKGSLYGTGESDFYGILTEIIELEYPALPIKKTVLFKCDWFDPTINVGISVHDRYKMVDVNCRRKYNKYEPFILAGQSGQVCYCTYPSKRRDRANWLAVCKMKARSEIDMPEAMQSETIIPPFQDDIAEHSLNVITNEEPTNLADPSGEAEEDVFDMPLAAEENDEFSTSSSSDEENVYEEDDD